MTFSEPGLPLEPEELHFNWGNSLAPQLEHVAYCMWCSMWPDQIPSALLCRQRNTANNQIQTINGFVEFCSGRIGQVSRTLCPVTSVDLFWSVCFKCQNLRVILAVVAFIFFYGCLFISYLFCTQPRAIKTWSFWQCKMYNLDIAKRYRIEKWLNKVRPRVDFLLSQRAPTCQEKDKLHDRKVSQKYDQ